MAMTSASIEAPREVNPSPFNGFDRQIDEAHVIALGAESLADSLCGGRPPSADSTSAPRPVPNGLLSKLEQHQIDMSALLLRAGAAIDRIRNQLP